MLKLTKAFVEVYALYSKKLLHLWCTIAIIQIIVVIETIISALVISLLIYIITINIRLGNDYDAPASFDIGIPHLLRITLFVSLE